MKLSETVWVLNTVLHGGQERQLQRNNGRAQWAIGQWPAIGDSGALGKIPGRKKPEYPDCNLQECSGRVEAGWRLKGSEKSFQALK